MSTTAPKSLKIRTAKLLDAEAIAKVHIQSWQETYRGHLPDAVLDRLSLESRTIMWTDAMNTIEADKHLFVAEIDGEIVAFISGGRLRKDSNSLEANNLDESEIETELYAIYCLRQYQGLSIGKLLVKALVSAFIQAEYSQMLVWVLRTNPSKHFYMHLGASFYAEKDLVMEGTVHKEQAYVWTSLQTLQSTLQV